MNGQDDQIVQEPHRLGVGPRNKLINRFDELMRAEHLRCVQSAVEPDNAFPFFGERSSLLVGQPLCSRQPPRNLFVAFQPLMVLG
jgi:hypothetical protein